jgi:S-disulfanyl-L-cysteine oxidoreductase SoxD
MRWLTFLVYPFLCVSLQAQTTSLDGVYTSAQAVRGARTYQKICSECHEGGEPDADPLFGAEFIERWREAPLDFLYGFYSQNMPADEPGTLSVAVYQEVLAFLLQENGYPAGTKELTAAQLANIQLVGENGPAPLPPSALVRVIGCLQPAGNTWQLSQATLPARVRTADETSPEELAQAATTTLGEATYGLRRAENFSPTALRGKQVQAKGILNSDQGSAELSVLSLTAAGAGC